MTAMDLILRLLGVLVVLLLVAILVGRRIAKARRALEEAERFRLVRSAAAAESGQSVRRGRVS